MNKHQNVCSNGNRQEQKIPLYIIEASSSSHLQNQIIGGEDNLQQLGPRWPDQRLVPISDHGFWMEGPFEESVFIDGGSRKGKGHDGQLGNKTKESKNTTTFTSDVEAKQKHQPLHLGGIDGHNQRWKDGFPPPPFAPGEAARHQQDEVFHKHSIPSFRTNYVNVMFSSYSIKGWGNNGTGSTIPCHHIHLIKQPALLTLSSYPFRIVYANDALLRLRRTSNEIVGIPFFDLFFVSDDLLLKPSLSRSDVLLGLLLNGIGVSMMRIGSGETRDTVVPCFTKAYPVVSSQMGAEQIVCFAMSLDVRI